MKVAISRKDAGFHDGDATQVAVASGSIVVNFSNGFAVVVPFEDLENLVVQHTEVVNTELLEMLRQCRRAFDAMPVDVLGHNEREGWPYLEELASRVDAIIAKARGES